MDPLKVLFTIGSLGASSGGPSRSVVSLADALYSCGVSPTIFTMKSELERYGTLSPSCESVKIVEATRFSFLNRSIPFSWDLSRILDRELRSLLPNIVHINGIWLPTSTKSEMAARNKGIPVIVSPRGMLQPWAFKHHEYRKKLAWLFRCRAMLQNVSCFHVTSDGEMETVKSFGFNKPIAKIDNGVSEAGFQIDNDFSKRERIVLFVGRIHPVKGLNNLIYAWAKVHPIGWKLVIAGPDECNHINELKMLARSLGVEHDINFPGYVTDGQKWPLFGNARLFVLPSYTENFGISVAEALSASMPVITTNMTPWHFVESEGCGWSVDVDINELASALTLATSLPEADLSAMGARGRNFVRKKYSWTTQAEKMKSVYRWVLGEESAPDYIWNPKF